MPAKISIAGRGPVRPSKLPTEWEPSPRDLEIYHYLKQKHSTREVAAIMEKSGTKVSHETVRLVGIKIDEWLRVQWMDNIRGIMVQQSEALMEIFQQAMEAWELSKCDKLTVTEKIGDVDELPEIITKREHNKTGDAKFLSEARGALADIRKIWGAETKASAFNGDAGDEFDPTGMTRDEARAEYFEQQAKLLREREARAEQLEPQVN